jgi:hypothetical protein
MELGLRAYTPSDRDPWDSVVRSSRGPSFLLERNYLEYHADRFVDRSLVFTLDGELQALLPANVVGQTLWSHQGLTFGGLIVAERSRSSTTMAAFEALVHWMRSEGLKRLIYKPIPAIYHKVPCQEDLYALHRLNARLIRRDLSSTIDQEARLRYSKGRRAAVSRARREGVSVESSHDFLTFMELEEQVLQSRHGVRPVHTGAEMQMLAERFPKSILLHVATRGGRILAGVIIYRTARVAHAQYIASGDEGRETGALDYLLDTLLNHVYRDLRFFDFGISTEDGGRRLNEGLLAHKESFGARSTVYDWYELTIPMEPSHAA